MQEQEELPSTLDHIVAAVGACMTGTPAGTLAARKVPAGRRADTLRAIEVHEKGCPASQSVQRGIAIEWDGDVVEE